MATLLELDLALFYFVNVSLSNGFTDYLMVWITDKHNWYLPGAFVWLFLIIKGGKSGRILAVLVIFGILCADQISASLLKPGFERLRPCKALEGFRLLTHCGSVYGFPSSHAANIGVLALLFSHFRPAWRWVWLVLALLIGISRVYVGVHYPFDVLAGWILGAAIGLVLIALYHHLAKRYPVLEYRSLT